jgi:smad nuclear-interacting protein 1
VLKYNEPVEARKPTLKYKLYCFKGDDQLEPLDINNQSAYLFGRERKIADIPIDHLSCSKQHAVLQYRQINSVNEYGDKSHVYKP